MFNGVSRNVDTEVSSVPPCQFFGRPLRLLANLDLWEEEAWWWKLWGEVTVRIRSWRVPYRSSEQRVKGVEPVVHVFLVEGLQEDTSMFCAHSKRVRSLKRQKTTTTIFAEWHIVYSIIHFFSCSKKKNLLFLMNVLYFVLH